MREREWATAEVWRRRIRKERRELWAGMISGGVLIAVNVAMLIALAVR